MNLHVQRIDDDRYVMTIHAYRVLTISAAVLGFAMGACVVGLVWLLTAAR